MKMEHDMLSDHGKVTSDPTKLKWLSLKLTKFDKDERRIPKKMIQTIPATMPMMMMMTFKYLGMQPGAKSMAESVDTTCLH